MTSLGQKGPEFVPVCTNSDKKIKINNHTIFEESNSFFKSVFENYNILMPPHPYFLVVTSLIANLSLLI